MKSRGDHNTWPRLEFLYRSDQRTLRRSTGGYHLDGIQKPRGNERTEWVGESLYRGGAAEMTVRSLDRRPNPSCCKDYDRKEHALALAAGSGNPGR